MSNTRNATTVRYREFNSLSRNVLQWQNTLLNAPDSRDQSLAPLPLCLNRSLRFRQRSMIPTSLDMHAVPMLPNLIVLRQAQPAELVLAISTCRGQHAPHNLRDAEATRDVGDGELTRHMITPSSLPQSNSTVLVRTQFRLLLQCSFCALLLQLAYCVHLSLLLLFLAYALLVLLMGQARVPGCVAGDAATGAAVRADHVVGGGVVTERAGVACWVCAGMEVW